MHDSASLISPMYNQAGFTCSFEFWYRIHGLHSGIIRIFYRSELTESLLGLVDSKTDINWERFSVDLPTCANQFQLVMEGVRGDDLMIVMIKNSMHLHLFFAVVLKANQMIAS